MTEFTTDKIKEIMKCRGYEQVSHNESAHEITQLNYVKRIGNFTIYANVRLKNASVALSFRELQYFCQIASVGIAIDHPDFEKYEQIIALYAAKCVDIDALSFLNNWKEGVAAKISLPDRIEKFKKKVIFIGKDKGYPPQMCKEFFNYWSEVNEDGKKMRWEIAKSKGGVFNIERRLITWAGKEQQYNAKFADRDEKKAKKQNEEIKTVKKVNTKELF